MHDQLNRRFLWLSEDHVAVDPQALALGQARFIRYENARDPVNEARILPGVLARMRSAGMLADLPADNPRLAGPERP